MTDFRPTARSEVDEHGYDQEGKLPRLVRVYIRQCLIGFGLAVIFVGLLLYFDIARLRSLILATQGGWMALGLLVFFNGVVFAGVQFAITIMRMAEPRKPGGGWGALAPTWRFVAEPRTIRIEESEPRRSGSH